MSRTAGAAGDAPPLVRTARPLGLIVAIARNGVIGRGGGLPWDYPEDREHFHRTTRGHVVIMGRRTWEETGAPLSERTNVVVSRSQRAPPPALTFPTLDEALRFGWEQDEMPFVIGGARLFEEALPIVTTAFVTEVPEAPPGDTTFRFDARGFRLADERWSSTGLRFLIYQR